MKRALLAFVSMALVALCLGAWSPRWEQPPLPRAGRTGDGIGLQVCLAEVDALGERTLLGVTEIRGFPARTARVEQFAVNVSRAAGLIAQGAGRPDLELPIAMMTFGPKDAAALPDSMTCTCAIAIRDRQGKFLDCLTTACGGCAHCVVREPI